MILLCNGYKMVYITSYTLSVNKEGIDTTELANVLFETMKSRILCDESSYEKSSYEKVLDSLRQMVDKLVHDDNYDGAWQSCFDDMEQVSMLYPGYRFMVQAEREKSDDSWIAYFISGKKVMYNNELFINWMVKKYHDDRKQLFEEYISTNIK